VKKAKITQNEREATKRAMKTVMYALIRAEERHPHNPHNISSAISVDVPSNFRVADLLKKARNKENSENKKRSTKMNQYDRENLRKVIYDWAEFAPFQHEAIQGEFQKESLTQREGYFHGWNEDHYAMIEDAEEGNIRIIEPAKIKFVPPTYPFYKTEEGAEDKDILLHKVLLGEIKPANYLHYIACEDYHTDMEKEIYKCIEKLSAEGKEVTPVSIYDISSSENKKAIAQRLAKALLSPTAHKTIKGNIKIPKNLYRAFMELNEGKDFSTALKDLLTKALNENEK
jgi:hypothetical protein